MEISEIGEFGLIKRLTQTFPVQQLSTVKGVGDDAAVLNPSAGVSGSEESVTLVTTDMLLEGIHFNLEYVPLHLLGYKSVAVNVSDICAMNGTATQITIGLGISSRFKVEDIEQFYRGVREACEEYKVDLVGGDTCASMNGLTVAVTCIGRAEKNRVVYRNGAKKDDLICVTGNLGSAYLGLQLLERELQVFRSTYKNDASTGSGADAADHVKFEGKEYLLERQLKPRARVDIIEALRQADIHPTAMMDISDGLSSELFHICTQSGVGCAIYEDKLPINFKAAEMADEMNLNIVTCALNGGEDYELLFTCDIHDYEKLVPLDDVYIIGHIIDSSSLCLVPRDGQPFPLTAQGWTAFAKA